MGMITNGTLVVTDTAGSKNHLDVETFNNKKDMISYYLWHLSIEEMKEVRKLATKYIADKKREARTT